MNHAPIDDEVFARKGYDRDSREGRRLQFDADASSNLDEPNPSVTWTWGGGNNDAVHGDPSF